MNVTDVSCGICCQKGRILICGRKGKDLAQTFWEFPGGKCEKGESISMCLKREIYEELGCHIAVLDPLGENVVDLGEKKYHLYFVRFMVLPDSPAPIPREGQEMQWVDLADLSEINILPGDRQIASFLAKSAKFLSTAQ